MVKNPNGETETYAYNDNGNLIEEITWERPYGASGDSLDDCDPDAVKRHRYYWYDQSNRLTAAGGPQGSS